MNTPTSISFLQKIKSVWGDEIQPILHDVMDCITQIVEKKNDPTFFKKCEPVDVYTQIYKITSDYQFDYCHLDYLYHQEIDTITNFCKRFSIHDLKEMNRQIIGFQILLKWLQCFFHHLNRYRCRVYHNVFSTDDDMIFCVRKNYMKPQKEIISHLLCEAWFKIRNNNYEYDYVLLDSMRFIQTFYPKYYHDCLFLYFRHVREFSQEKSREWSSHDNHIYFMNQTLLTFQNEKKMFLSYFTQQEHLRHIYTILKRTFISPYAHKFLKDHWKPILHENIMADIQTAYHYFCWMDDQALWLDLYQEFIEERIQEARSGGSVSNDNIVFSLVHLLRQQTTLLEDIFIDEKVRVSFASLLEKNIQKYFIDHPQIITQLTRLLHHSISKKASQKIMDDLSILVGFCHNKEVFYENYHFYLKSRLLSGRFYFSHEKDMLYILQQKHGASFVLNLNMMLKEIQNNLYLKKQCALFALSGIVWKFNKVSTPLQYKIPHTIERNLEILYTRARKKIQPSIHLERLWHEGSVILSRNQTDFYMSPIQAIVLMAFDGTEMLTRENLLSRLQIPDNKDHNLDGVLESLMRVHFIKPDSDNHDLWHWNDDVKHPMPKIIVPPVRPFHQQQKNIAEQISLPIVVKAFIVRRLKQEKTMNSNKLVGLVLKTYPEARTTDVKNVMETLIDQEYIEKDKHNNVSYVP